MQPGRDHVLILGEGDLETRAIVPERLRRLGLVPGRARDAVDLAARCHDPKLAFLVILLAKGRLPNEIAALPSAVRHRIAAGELSALAVGERPSEDQRKQLRQAGVQLAVFEPFDERALRFQVNRALAASPRGGKLRVDARAPIHWPVAVRVADRRKGAETYTVATGGAFLETARPSMVGARLDLELPLPRGVAVVHGWVVHTNVTGNLANPALPSGMGVRFCDPRPDVIEEISQLVRERTAALTP
jgi:hypothetical protein